MAWRARCAGVVNSEDKAVVIALVGRMPEGATLDDRAREIERVAAERAIRERAATDSWIFGDLSRLEFRRHAHERATRFVERFLPLFGRSD